MNDRDFEYGPADALSAAVAMRDRNTIAMVKDAIRHEQVLMAYQPVVQAARPDRIAFYESLIRVMDETGRIIPARDFIDTVEESETGRLLDCISLQKGLDTLVQRPELRVSVNMSARSIGYGRWRRIMTEGLDADPTVGERLILEITEHSAVLVPELVASFMHDMQARGISFALDDFGAGFTAFRHLKDFQFDILKIDGQFIRDIASDADNQVITAAMLSIAQQFDMFTVAETVERAEDAAYLAKLGVDCMQGYYFGAPTVHPPWLTTLPEALRA